MICCRTRLASVALALLVATPASLAAQTRTGSAPAPARLWAAQISPREVTLAWDSVTGAKGFRLYRGSGESAQVIGRVESRVLRWVVPVKAEMVGAPQQFAIEALDAAGLPSPRAAFNVVTPIAVTPGGGQVAAPATVTASEGGGGVTVTWDAVPGATAYFIGRAVRPGGFRVLCGLCSTQTTYVDRGLPAGAVVSYSVTAVTPRTTSRATRSKEITLGGGGIVAAGGGGTSGTGGTGGTSGTSGSGGTGGTGGGTDTTGGAGVGGTGGTTTATAPPPPPSGIVVRPSTFVTTGVEVSWQGGAGAQSFRVSRAVCGRPPQEVTTLPAGGPGTARPWVDTIPAATIRTMCTADFFGMRTVGAVYTVVAVNAAGSSPPVTSPPASFRISASTLDAMSGTGTTSSTVAVPTPLSINVTGAMSVALNWQSSAGATSYVLSRSVCGKPVQVVKTVPTIAGSPNVTESDYVPWDTINVQCPIGSTTADVVYSVSAKSGDAASASAQFPKASLQLGQMVYGTSPPSAPSTGGPIVRFLSNGTASLTWYGVSGATQYRVERAIGAKGSFQFLTSVMSESSNYGIFSYTDSTPGITTQSPAYRVIAINPRGSSAPTLFTRR